MSHELQTARAGRIGGDSVDVVPDGVGVESGSRALPDVEAVIRKVICGELALREKDVTLETTLGSLDADSLEIASLMQALEDELGVELEDRDFGRTTTVKQLVEYANR